MLGKSYVNVSVNEDVNENLILRALRKKHTRYSKVINCFGLDSIERRSEKVSTSYLFRNYC